MNRKYVFLDLLFYVGLPFIIWNYGRELLGDYPAMLISTIPGLIYSLSRFILERQFNITGMFIISSLFITTTVNVFSESAEQMLWNGIYLSLFYAMIHLFTLMIKRPLALYFAVDFVSLQGWPKKQSTPLFFEKDIFKWFQYIQLLFVIRGFALAGLKTLLLQKYGVDGFNQMLIYRQVTEWFFSLLILGLFIYTNVPISKVIKQKKLEDKIENA